MQTSVSENWLRISVAGQTLEVRDAAGAVRRSFPVSTSQFGLGSAAGSFRTPLGRLRIAEKIGAGAGSGVVFLSRVPTAESGEGRAGEDLVQTRILWLEGAEELNANTRERYIYIHGTNHEEAIGQPASHGCVRMKNADVIELFDLVAEGAEVRIEDA
jgi:L,D-transpeptidase YbiS